MNKKFLLILTILTLFLILLLSVSTSAATITSAEVTITPSKTECKAGETIEYTISLKNLNASAGILGFGAYIEYNSDLLTLNTKAKGLSDWSDATIFEGTHRFVTTKETRSSNNEDILKITFTVKETSKNTETAIKLKKIEISNGTQYNIAEVSSSKVTILASSTPTVAPTPTPNATPTVAPTVAPTQKVTPTAEPTPNATPTAVPSVEPTSSATPTTAPTSSVTPTVAPSAEPTQDVTPTLAPTVTPPVDQNPEDDNKPTPTIPASNLANGEKDSSTSGKIPETGSNNYLSIIILALVIVAVILFVKIKVINKKINKQNDDFIDKDDENK